MQATSAMPSVYSEQSGYMIIDERRSYLNLSSFPIDFQNDSGLLSIALASNFHDHVLNRTIAKELDTSTLASEMSTVSYKTVIYRKIRQRFEGSIFQEFLDQIRIYDNADGEFDGMDLLSSYVDDLLVSGDVSLLNTFVVQFLMQKFSYQFHIHLLMLIKHKDIDSDVKDALIQSAAQAGRFLGRSNVDAVIEFAK